MIISICYVCSPTDCTLLAVCSPTECTEYTEPSCCIFSHGLHSSCSIFSHGIHGIHRTFLPYILPQNSRNSRKRLLKVFSHRLHRFSQNLLAVYSPTEFTEYTEPSCCIFSHGLHRFSQMLLSWCTCLSVSICEICGRILSATSSVNSVNSVGEYLGRVISVGVLPVNLLLAMLAQIGVALREVVVAEPPATVGRQR